MPLDTPNHYAGYTPLIQPPAQDYPQNNVIIKQTPGSEGTQSVIQPEGEAPSKDDRQDTHSVQTGTP